MKLYIVTTSWDDGHKLDLKLARLLKKYGIKGTFYISPFYLKNRLSEEEIKELSEYHEVGAHTLTHVDLTSVPIDKAEKEIRDSKLYLEKVLGHKISMFCYPKGKYNRRIKEIVKKCGFLGARTCNGGNFEPPKDPYEWGITLHASNGSPLMTLKICVKSKIPAKALLDWEYRAKLLFDLFLKHGGIYHLYGHSWEIDKNYEWLKLKRVLQYISNKNEVQYLTNGEALGRCMKE
ncbi:MAG: polysaccharide deacetylase family protein [Candidatus Bathyarchaeia archaeon]